MKKYVIILIAGLLAISILLVPCNRGNTPPLPGGIIPINQGITIAYLIRIPDGYMLVDTGYEKDYAAFLGLLRKKNIAIGDIRFLFLTHHHDDHSGYINKLTRANPGLRIIAHEKTIPLLASGKNNTGNGGGIVNRRIYLLFRMKQIVTPGWDLSFPPFRLRPRDIIIRGDRAPLPVETGIAGAIIHTPGHSSDSISLLTADGYLLCGDLASNFLNWAGARNLTLFNEDIGRVYASWKLVIEMNTKTVVPSHGDPFSIQKLRDNLYQGSADDVVTFF